MRRNVILLLILYGHESWFLTLGKLRRLRVFENTILRRIFGPKWDEVTREWRRLTTEEFMICTTHKYYSGDQIKIISWAGYVACMGDKRYLYRVLVGKPDRKNPSAKPTHITENNSNIDLK
jgi:hypothetical protein